MAQYWLVPGWRPGDGLLPALRSQYAYTDRSPDRATGWLYSARQFPGLPPAEWPEELEAHGLVMLYDLEVLTGIRFAAVCFQAYRDGAGCGWHHDRDWGAQAVLSLGVTRTFGLRRAGEEMRLRLAHGDLLVMPAGFQDEWEHCVFPEEAEGERCSLVFRSSK